MTGLFQNLCIRFKDNEIVHTYFYEIPSFMFDNMLLFKIECKRKLTNTKTSSEAVTSNMKYDIDNIAFNFQLFEWKWLVTEA